MVFNLTEYLKATTSKVRYMRAKVEFLRPDETPYLEITGDILNTTGSLNIANTNGIRRSIDFSLINIDKTYTPSPDGIWLRQKVKVSLGFRVDGVDQLIPQGIFVIDNPSAISNYSDKVVNINGIDKFSLLDGSLGGETENIYQIPAGTNIHTAIKKILQPTTPDQQLIVYDPIEPLLSQKYASVNTPYTIEKDTGTPLGEIILELAKMVSANVYYNTNGQLVFEEDFNDATKGSEIDYVAGDTNYLGATRDYKFNEVFNAIRVIGDNIDGQIFDAFIKNENAKSETSISRLGFMRVKTISDNNIYTDQLAIDRGNYELKRSTALVSQVNLRSLPLFHLDVDKVLTITDDSIELNKTRLLIDRISIPLHNSGTMDITVSLATDLVF